MISDEQRIKKQQKRDAWNKAVSFVQSNTKFKTLSSIAHELGHNLIKYYSIGQHKSVPTPEMAEQLYNRFPLPEVLDALADADAFQLKDEAESNIEYRILRKAYNDQPKLIERVEKLQHQTALQSEMINKLSAENRRLAKIIGETLKYNPKLRSQFDGIEDLLNTVLSD